MPNVFVGVANFGYGSFLLAGAEGSCWVSYCPPRRQTSYKNKA